MDPQTRTEKKKRRVKEVFNQKTIRLKEALAAKTAPVAEKKK
jgi:hypothetical protein|uniref:Uncharacterized protein n=1 Tax=viral metagenome TaxID=1070528 RepID=A0A6C0KYV0_9ZZZZ